ncbi:recombinase family protein, partial [Loigolactobacillus coryniformis]|uniref:recombinase family protein n=1 Tax=Loigolactobacillus coryniformis TaxID=1610 RepID=UPI00201B15E3
FISIAKQDRISRDTLLISTLIKNKVEFKAADNPNATDLIKFIYAALSQEELAKIRSRTRDALAAKKRRGEPLGINTWT